jgi:cell division septation protein DedD
MSEPLLLQSPLQIYRAGEKSIGTVDMQAVQSLAPITQLDAGTGVMRQGGEYNLNLASFATFDQARLFSERLNKSGLATNIIQVNVMNTFWWRVSVGALASLQDAHSLRQKLSGLKEVSSPWVSR